MSYSQHEIDKLIKLIKEGKRVKKSEKDILQDDRKRIHEGGCLMDTEKLKTFCEDCVEN